MSRIITPRERVESVENRMHFSMPSGFNFSFPCDSEGKVDVDSLPPEARENYFKCVRGNPIQSGRMEWVSVHFNPAVMRCDCGQSLSLHSSWANRCSDCGREYNGSAQLLAPREQWGSETGETFEDARKIEDSSGHYYYNPWEDDGY